MDNSKENQQLSADPSAFARSYQLEALEAAIKQNTIVYLETGSGKTLIAIMLLRHFAHQIRKPSSFFAVFLVPTVVLVDQQSKYLTTHTDLKTGKYWGDLGVDFWDAAVWKQEVDKFEVLVMTPQILLDALSHSFLKIEMIKVLIFDECHHARGKHAYARIMKEFYHKSLNSEMSHRPRIFGMTASLIKAKGSSSEEAVWKVISDLENLMNSKVYTCASESVLAEYIPFSKPMLKYYSHKDLPSSVLKEIKEQLNSMKKKHADSLTSSIVSEDTVNTARKKLDKLLHTFLFCLEEHGIWLAFKAAESSSHAKGEILIWDKLDKLDVRSDGIIRNFCSDASKIIATWIPTVQGWRIGANIKDDMENGYLTTKVICLIESLTEYSELKDLRCIIFVERVITAIVLRSLLDEYFSNTIGWKTAYTAGHNHSQAQSRNEQNKIVAEFRKGQVNIIVATSMLEEGLDVQSCNLVIRFDPSATVCSFIQSRGRARRQDSVFLTLVDSEDKSTVDRVLRYLKSGEVMRQQSLSHASDPCIPIDIRENASYTVESTGAIVNLCSSVQLVHHYCSRLPSDGYFKPYPRFVVDEASKKGTLHLPRSCPVQRVDVHGELKTLKQLACLEACIQLHEFGALTDNLVPDIVEEEADLQHMSLIPYSEEQVQYVPSQLVGCHGNEHKTQYYCYIIELTPNFQYAIQPHAIWLAVRSKLQLDDESICFDLHADRGLIMVKIRHLGEVGLTSEEVRLCQIFQNIVFRVLIDHDMNKLREVLKSSQKRGASCNYDYLLLPSSGSCQNPLIDWTCVCSVLFTNKNFLENHSSRCPIRGTDNILHTYNGVRLCRCALENCLVYTPHNKRLYCVSGLLDALNGNSLLKLRDGQSITYKDYYKQRHGLKLNFDTEPLLRGKNIFTMQNHLEKGGNPRKGRESTNTTVELPPELCCVVMSPVSVATFYSFSYCPSILHRIESLLLAADIKRMNAELCVHNDIPTIKVLEAITTKRCQETMHLESLETLGDSFLKYAVSRKLFTAFGEKPEGILSIKREKLICNTKLCELGCLRDIPGYIRNEPFDPKTWIVPGDYSTETSLDTESNSSKSSVYLARGTRKIRNKTVADVVEALIGAFLSSGGKGAALSFMNWLGIEVNHFDFPYTMPLTVHPSKLINVGFFESLLKYTFRDPSLLVEALTHGSYMLPEIPRSYQRLEFLGDSVLDFLITEHLYNTYPGSSPGLLTDLRSASVNNDFYARCAVNIGLHKHMLHTSQDLHQKIVITLENFDELSAQPSFGWESVSIFPKVLGDVIESIAGALLVDSGYDLDTVFKCMKPLLGPLITPELLKLHPVRELTELCQKEHYNLKKAVVVRCENGKARVEVEVEANGVVHKDWCSAGDKKAAKRLACKAVLQSLKERSAGLNKRKLEEM